MEAKAQDLISHIFLKEVPCAKPQREPDSEGNRRLRGKPARVRTGPQWVWTRKCWHHP